MRRVAHSTREGRNTVSALSRVSVVSSLSECQVRCQVDVRWTLTLQCLFFNIFKKKKNILKEAINTGTH